MDPHIIARAGLAGNASVPCKPSRALRGLCMASRVKPLGLASKAGHNVGLACLSRLFPPSAPSSFPVPQLYPMTVCLSPASVVLATTFLPLPGNALFPDSLPSSSDPSSWKTSMTFLPSPPRTNPSSLPLPVVPAPKTPDCLNLSGSFYLIHL